MAAITTAKSKVVSLGMNSIQHANVFGKHGNIARGITSICLQGGEHTSLSLQGNRNQLLRHLRRDPPMATYSLSPREAGITALHHNISTSNAFVLGNLPIPSVPLSKFSYQKLHTDSSNYNIFTTFATNESKESQSEDSKVQSTDGSANPEDLTTCVEERNKLKEEIEKMTTENNELKTKNEDVLDKYRRSIAENDNMRKRLQKQIEDAKIFGIQGFCKDLLDVADVLQKAVEAVKTEDEKSGGNLASGIELTQTQMYQVFNRHGLSQIAPVLGETKFDPNMHEALFQVPSPDKEQNTVMVVQQIGYSLHGRTIRPAKVGVSGK